MFKFLFLIIGGCVLLTVSVYGRLDISYSYTMKEYDYYFYDIEVLPIYISELKGRIAIVSNSIHTMKLELNTNRVMLSVALSWNTVYSSVINSWWSFLRVASGYEIFRDSKFTMNIRTFLNIPCTEGLNNYLSEQDTASGNMDIGLLIGFAWRVSCFYDLDLNFSYTLRGKTYQAKTYDTMNNYRLGGKNDIGVKNKFYVKFLRVPSTFCLSVLYGCIGQIYDNYNKKLVKNTGLSYINMGITLKTYISRFFYTRLNVFMTEYFIYHDFATAYRYSLSIGFTL